MFPRLRDRFGAALDTVVEFSTLGEYRLGVPASSPPSALPAVPEHWAGPHFGWEAPAALAAGDAGTDEARRTVAGGAAALHGDAPGRALLGASAATPAARRPLSHRPRRPLSHRPRRALERRRRPGAPLPPEQACSSPVSGS
jgi:hypothetical protein